MLDLGPHEFEHYSTCPCDPVPPQAWSQMHRSLSNLVHVPQQDSNSHKWGTSSHPQAGALYSHEHK